MKKILKFIFSVALILVVLVLFKISGEVHAEKECPTKENCTSCLGTGYINCPDCDGTAKDTSGDPCSTCIGVDKIAGKAVCVECSGTGGITVYEEHNWIPATTSQPKTCQSCGKYDGNVLIPDNVKTIDTYVVIGDVVLQNQLQLDDIIYFNTFVVDELPEEGIDAEIGVNVSGGSSVMNCYYNSNDKKIYVYLDEWYCWTDNPQLVENLKYGGLVSSEDEMIGDESFHLYFYWIEPEEDIAYQVQYVYQREEVGGMVDLIIKNDVVNDKNYTVQSISDIDVPGVEHDRKWSDNFIYETTAYQVGDSITLNKNNFDQDSETYINRIYVYVEYRLKGIQYYYEDKLIHTDKPVSWRTASLGEGLQFSRPGWCEFERVGYKSKLTEEVITTIEELEFIYEKLNLEEDYYAELEIVKLHDNYYYGPSVIYKRNNSFLTDKTINKILGENILSCEHVITYTFEDVDYVGNGAKLGTYRYKIKFEDSEQIVKIVVTDKINSDYIYGNNLYYPINQKLSTGQIVEDMKKTGLVSNTNLSTQFTGRNEASSNFLSGKNNQSGTYSYVIDYESATGESGSTQLFLNILEAKVFTTDDPIETPRDYKEIIENIIVALIVIALVLLIFCLLKKKRRK